MLLYLPDISAFKASQLGSVLKSIFVPNTSLIATVASTRFAEPFFSNKASIFSGLSRSNSKAFDLDVRVFAIR
ncbi:hypothetical protein D3C72_1847270 [compost metagenome]